MKRLLKCRGPLLLALALAGCASYHPYPLATKANLAPSLAALDRAVPSGKPNVPPMVIDPYQPLTIDQIGLLTILNDPDLAAEAGQLGVSRSALLAETLLPNPQLGIGFAALLGGPGASSPSYAASLSQDILALVTYRPRVAAARAAFHSLNASLLWQEWQAAQKARLLVLNIYGYDQQIYYRQRELTLLSNELAQVSRATQAGNLDLTAESPLIAANAIAEGALATVRLLQLRAWQDLDALLGLEPSVRFAISRPELPPPPADIAPLVASLPSRRPDLIALQLGYRASNEQLRVALIEQFPALSIGPSFAMDTSKVRSLGPAMTIGVPIFNRNQNGIMAANATREVLHAQYFSELDRSAGTVQSLIAQIQLLDADLAASRRATATATKLSRIAEQAYRSSSIDQRSLTDYETTVLERQLEVVDFQNQIDTDELTLSVELGLGLPQIRIAPTHQVNRS
jgi:cobalt-zinc-cadmium efflux system outer membrane protein